jgi:hypothetical protein
MCHVLVLGHVPRFPDSGSGQGGRHGQLTQAEAGTMRVDELDRLVG